MDLPITCPERDTTVWTPSFADSGVVSRLLSDYKGMTVLGSGAFGCVLEAENIIDGQFYAIKKIILENDYGYEKATREIIALATLSHPNVVRFHTSWLEEGPAGPARPAVREVSGPMLCIKMELCSGTLEELMAKGDLMEYKTIWKIFKQLVEALDYCHRLGVRHGDLNPRNIFVNKLGDIKIGDFGYTTLSPEGVFADNEFAPMTVYSAPEMIENSVDVEELKNNKVIEKKIRTYSRKSDVFSLGLVLLEMFLKLPDKDIRTCKLSEFVAERKCVAEGKFVTEAIQPASLNLSTLLLIREMCHYRPEARPSMSDIIKHCLWRVEDRMVGEEGEFEFPQPDTSGAPKEVED